MAHVWVRSAAGWEAKQLAGTVHALAAEIGLPPEQGAATQNALPRLLHSEAGGKSVWLVMAAAQAGVRVNGRALPAGLAVLADRDEIRTSDGLQFFFTTETLATPVAFPGSQRPMICPRCRLKIDAGTIAVRCPGPGCGLWYHHSEESPCWLYAEKCVFCDQSTAMDVGFSWTPEE